MSATFRWQALAAQAEEIRVCIHCGDPVDPLDPFADECERCDTLLSLAADWQENGCAAPAYRWQITDGDERESALTIRERNR
jgi:hypothetical protein